MLLVLLRHGEAERDAVSDSQRRLTARGEREATATGVLLASLLQEPLQVVCSPYSRARRTADLVAVETGAGAVREIAGITPDDDPRRALLVIAGHCVPGSALLVVTHMPLIGSLLALLVEGDARHPPGVPTAGGAVLEGEFVTPGAMRIRMALF